MSTVTIRDAEETDIPAITAIYQYAVLNETASFELEPPDEPEMLARMRVLTGQDYPYIVAVNTEGKVIAYAYAGPFRARPAYRWSVEDSIYIDPQARGLGLGRTLLAQLIEQCQQLGFRQMIAVIGGADHAPSIRLHETAGFRTIGIFEGSGFKFGRWIDTVFMQLRLGDGRHSLPDEAAYPGNLLK